jgi:cell filamentation protein
MYDAIDDPYTYENSTVLVNKLDLRDQDELGSGPIN